MNYKKGGATGQQGPPKPLYGKPKSRAYSGGSKTSKGPYKSFLDEFKSKVQPFSSRINEEGFKPSFIEKYDKAKGSTPDEKMASIEGGNFSKEEFDELNKYVDLLDNAFADLKKASIKK